MSDFELHQGDCLDIMKSFKTNSIDAIITDPPYGLNTKSASRGANKINPWADLVNSAFWYSAWMKESFRLIHNGPFWCFLNWRSFVTFQKAILDAGESIESLLVWDKQWIGPGGPIGLRPSYELVLLARSGEWALKNRGLPDIWQSQWSSKKPTGHPAEKPVSLIKRMILESNCDVILDPFMGSGTTGVACAELGRKFIGIEIDKDYYSMAEKRIGTAYSQKSMFNAPPA